MSTRLKRGIAGSQLTTSAATYYTAPANVTVQIVGVRLVNTTASNVTATVHLIASGGSASASNTYISARTLAPGETYNCPELTGQVLETGGFLQALASSNTSITITGSVVEVTNG